MLVRWGSVASALARPQTELRYILEEEKNVIIIPAVDVYFRLNFDFPNRKKMLGWLNLETQS